MFSLLKRLCNVLPAPEAKAAIFIGAILSVAVTFANVQPAPKDHYLVQDIVQRILRLTDRAQTDEDWHENQFEIDVWSKLLFSSRYRPEARCEVLKKLSNSDLLTFYTELHGADPTIIKPCRIDLVRRMDEFLTERKMVLEQSYLQLVQKYLANCSEQKSDVFGPEQDLFVEASTSPRLTGHDHPSCGLTLTFDDGPHPTLTEKLLDTLKANNVLVNFFVVGTRVQSKPGIVQRAHSEGHLIGNHSQSHLDLRRETPAKAFEEIDLGFERIIEAIHFYLPFFRFPYGASTPELRNYLQSKGQVEFFWNIDTRDWAIKDPVELFTYSLKQINNVKRGIVLYHDIQPQTVTMMPYLLSALTSAGYQPYLIRPKQ